MPKLPVPAADVTASGIVGDGHEWSGHGGPERALCLYSLERILALQAEGHPVYPGPAGENLTVSGLEWGDLVPGDRLRIGESVEIGIPDYTDPSRKIAASFSDGTIERMSHDRHPGWAHPYARVRIAGTIRPGDRVSLVGP